MRNGAHPDDGRRSRGKEDREVIRPESSTHIVVHPGFSEAEARAAGWTPEADRAFLANGGTVTELITRSFAEGLYPTPERQRFRIRQLRLAADLLNDGRLPEPGWTAAQLRDFAEILQGRLDDEREAA